MKAAGFSRSSSTRPLSARMPRQGLAGELRPVLKFPEHVGHLDPGHDVLELADRLAHALDASFVDLHLRLANRRRARGTRGASAMRC
jgi:hypothetical protein